MAMDWTVFIDGEDSGERYEKASDAFAVAKPMMFERAGVSTAREFDKVSNAKYGHMARTGIPDGPFGIRVVNLEWEARKV